MPPGGARMARSRARAWAPRILNEYIFFWIVGGFYSEVALQKREAEGTVRTQHQLNLDPNPEGTQKILDDRQYGGREEQRILHVGGGAGVHNVREEKRYKRVSFF